MNHDWPGMIADRDWSALLVAALSVMRPYVPRLIEAAGFICIVVAIALAAGLWPALLAGGIMLVTAGYLLGGES